LPIQDYTLALIRARFRTRQIGADGRGLKAFVLAAPAPAASVGAGVPVAPGATLPPFGCA
jgi:hypothetical protein